MSYLSTYGAVDLPYMDSLAFSRRFSTNESKRLLASDPTLSSAQRMQVMTVLNSAEQQEPGYRGLISSRDILRAGVGAGIGYAGAKALAGVVGRAVGLPPHLQSRAAQLGAIGGALRATGVWQN